MGRVIAGLVLANDLIGVDVYYGEVLCFTGSVAAFAREYLPATVVRQVEAHVILGAIKMADVESDI